MPGSDRSDSRRPCRRTEHWWDPVQTKANLDAKLVDASVKLAEGKYEQAIAKLVDFRTSVENLAAAPKPKISQGDAQLLIADANNAIACIQGLIVEG